MVTLIEQANLRKRVQIECAVWHLDVGLAHPHECKNHEGFDCSSIKELHELGLVLSPLLFSDSIVKQVNCKNLFKIKICSEFYLKKYFSYFNNK